MHVTLEIKTLKNSFYGFEPGKYLNFCNDSGLLLVREYLIFKDLNQKNILDLYQN